MRDSKLRTIRNSHYITGRRSQDKKEGRLRDKKNNSTKGENFGCQKMNLINPSKEKNQKSWILKTVYGKHSIYFSDFKKKFSYRTKSLGFLS